MSFISYPFTGNLSSKITYYIQLCIICQYTPQNKAVFCRRNDRYPKHKFQFARLMAENKQRQIKSYPASPKCEGKKCALRHTPDMFYSAALIRISCKKGGYINYNNVAKQIFHYLTSLWLSMTAPAHSIAQASISASGSFTVNFCTARPGNLSIREITPPLRPL